MTTNTLIQHSNEWKEEAGDVLSIGNNNDQLTNFLQCLHLVYFGQWEKLLVVGWNRQSTSVQIFKKCNTVEKSTSTPIVSLCVDNFDAEFNQIIIAIKYVLCHYHRKNVQFLVLLIRFHPNPLSTRPMSRSNFSNFKTAWKRLEMEEAIRWRVIPKNLSEKQPLILIFCKGSHRACFFFFKRPAAFKCGSAIIDVYLDIFIRTKILK